MNKYIIITARCNSSRLKNKILAKITKKYLAIDIIILRAMRINKPICLATSTHKSDDKLVNYVKSMQKCTWNTCKFHRKWLITQYLT